MENSHQLTTVGAISTFLWAGNAIVTLVSKATGQRYTFKVRQPEAHDDNATPPHFVMLLAGPDNGGDYVYMGAVFADRPGKLTLTRKSQFKYDSTPVKAFQYLLNCLAHDTLGQLEVWHEGRCGRCGKRLTVPESIETGLGPVCAGLA